MKAVGSNHCAAMTKAGKSCRAAPTAGGLCFFHANPNKPAELGRIGGTKKGSTVDASATELSVGTASAVRDLGARLIADILAGRMNPRTASGLAPLMSLQLRAIEVADLRDGRRPSVCVEPLLA